MKADKSQSEAEVNRLLEELGNTGGGIPYYAIFVPGQDEPIHFDGIFCSADPILEKLKLAAGTSDGEVDQVAHLPGAEAPAPAN